MPGAGVTGLGRIGIDELRLLTRRRHTVTAVTVATIAGMAATVLATGTGRAATTPTPAMSVLIPSQPTEPGGTWSPPQPVPGLAALFPSGPLSEGGIDGISCAAPGNCSATGTYWTSSQTPFPFLVSEVNGVRGNAEDIPGLAALSTVTGKSAVRSVSCGASGDCVLVGYYPDSSSVYHSFRH